MMSSYFWKNMLTMYTFNSKFYNILLPTVCIVSIFVLAITLD